MSYAMTLNIAPVAKERARVTRFGSYTPAKTRQFESALATLIRSKIGSNAPLVGPVKLCARFIVATPKRPKWSLPAVRPDLDNYLKALKDAANGLLWLDDGQISEVHAWKLYDMSGGKPRIEIEVTPAMPEGES